MMVHRRSPRSVREASTWDAYLRVRYAILFYCLLMMLVALPAASVIGLPQLAVKLLFGCCLLAALMPGASLGTRRLLSIAVALLVAGRVASEYASVPIHPGVILALVGITGLIAAGRALRFAVTAVAVDREIIYAALSTYLLAGLFFAQIYWAIEGTMPGSFTGPDSFSEVTAVYYSFVTLATLGYGDFVPRTDLARGVAVFQVIGGQLFLAVMVARLIGLFGGPKVDD